MPYGELWEIVGPDWRLMAAALGAGIFVVAVVLIRNISRIWKRIETIETQISKVQNELTTVLQLYAALIRKPNANSKVEIDSRGTAVEMGGGDVPGQMSHPATPAQPESEKSAKLPGLAVAVCDVIRETGSENKSDDFPSGYSSLRFPFGSGCQPSSPSSPCPRSLQFRFLVGNWRLLSGVDERRGERHAANRSSAAELKSGLQSMVP